MSDYSELKAAAEAASKHGHHIYINARDDGNWLANSKFHVDCTPDIVLELLKELEVSTSVGKALGITLGNVVEGRDALVLAVENLKAESKRLVARDAMHVQQFNGLSQFRDRTVKEFDAKVARLEAEAEALRKDAERYRFLRDPAPRDCAPECDVICGVAEGEDVLWSGDLDRTIDAAMSADDD